MQALATIWAWIAARWKLWEWPERLLKWWRGWHELREAKYRAERAKAELPAVEWEARVSLMIRKIRKIQNDAQASNPGKNLYLDIQPSPEDDLEVFREAMRRIKAQSQVLIPRRWSPRWES